MGCSRAVLLLMAVLTASCGPDDTSATEAPCALLTEEDAERLLGTDLTRSRIRDFMTEAERSEASQLDDLSCVWVPIDETDTTGPSMKVALWDQSDRQPLTEFRARIEGGHEPIEDLGTFAGIKVLVGEMDISVVVDDDTWIELEVVGDVRPDDAIELMRRIVEMM